MKKTAPHAVPSASADTRELLMKTAKKVFAQHGFDGATVKQIADEAGVNVSLVSYHFHGKEGLYRACFEQVGKARLMTSERILKHPASLEEFRVRLQMYAEDFILWSLEEPDVSLILNRECISEMPLTKDIFRETFLKSFEILVEFFAAAQKRRLLKMNSQPFLVTGLYFGSLIHLVRTQQMVKEIFGVSLEDKAYRDQVVESSVDNLMYGIIPRPTASGGSTPAQRGSLS